MVLLKKLVIFSMVIFIGLCFSRQLVMAQGYVLGKANRNLVGERSSTKVNQRVDESEEDIQLKLYQLQKQLLKTQNELSQRDIEVQKQKKKLKEYEMALTRMKQELQVAKEFQPEYYEVKKGDNLWKIAKRKSVYGNANMWMKLYTANIKILEDPNMIYPGQLLVVPE